VAGLTNSAHSLVNSYKYDRAFGNDESSACGGTCACSDSGHDIWFCHRLEELQQEDLICRKEGMMTD